MAESTSGSWGTGGSTDGASPDGGATPDGGASPDGAPADGGASADAGWYGTYSPSAAVCTSATAAAALQPYARGFNTRQLVDWALTSQDALVTRALDEMVRTRSRVHRLTLYWWDVEPARGSFDWAKYDRVVNAAAARGLQLVIDPVGSPNWARKLERQITDPNRKFRFFAYPDDAAAWSTFMRALASHYGAKVYAYEIWNEENSRPFWDPATNTDPDPVRYKDLFCRAATEVRAVRGAGALVGIGGITARRATWNDGLGVREMRASTYLNRAYNAGIAACNPSFVGYHPYVFKSYCGANPTMASTPGFRELGSVRDVMVNRGQSAKKIWMTEWSFPSRPFQNGLRLCSYSGSKQASLIGREHNYIRTRPNVRYSMYFNYLDAPGDSRADFNLSVGLARTDWSHKLSWNTWRSLAQTAG
jgi:hypothetical protein